MRTRTRLILGLLFFALMFVYAGANAYQTFAVRRSSTGWAAGVRDGRVVVSEVNPAGPAALLVPSDALLSLDGQRVESPAQVYGLLTREPGQAYTVAVLREGRTHELTLRTTPVPPFATTYYTLLVVVIPAIFLVTGLAVFLLKPDDKQAVLLALLFGMFIPSDPGTYAGLHAWLVGAMILGGVVSSFFAAVFFHFFLVFPERSPLLRRWPRLEQALYVPQLLLFAPFVAYTSVYQAVDLKGYYATQERLAAPGVAVSCLLVAYLAAGVVSLLVNYRQASAQSRRKMKVVVAGCMVGFLPSLLVTGVYLAGPTRVGPDLFRWLSAASVLAFLVFPVSFAYAIVRHQVIPVRFILRRGVRYLFVARGSVLLEVVTVGAALGLLLHYLFTYAGHPSGLVIGVTSGVFSVVVWNLTKALHHRVIAPAIDRRFFRRAYNAQQILADLGQALRQMTDVRGMTELACARVQDALQPENVSIFLRAEATGDFVCAISSSYAAVGRKTHACAEELVIPREAFTVRRLRESAQALTVDFNDPQSWASMLLASDMELSVTRRRESETLRAVNASLLVPVATKSELLGVISLGPRMGDLPFSREDRQMLAAVAWQMAFAFENSQLVRRMAEEERLRREIDMATEVQRRLFPECPPQLATLDLAGLCIPARGVGGDYYDFIQLDGGRVGVAVADVAGKGISAALLMSTVQASLRSQAPTVGDRLTELVCSMNRLLNRSTNSASYASFFYAQFDERTRRLTYVNAGHNPPLLVRAGGAAAQRLEVRRLAAGADDGGAVLVSSAEETATTLLTTGGPVIGLFDEFTYDQESLQTHPGDLVVAYTDGVTEALNPRGEEFGETRLHDLVASRAGLPADEIVAEVIARLREWCRDTPQHDDVTLVAMKVR